MLIRSGLGGSGNVKGAKPLDLTYVQSLTHLSVDYEQIRQSGRQMVVHVLVQHNESAWSDLILKGSHPRTDRRNATSNQ